MDIKESLRECKGAVNDVCRSDLQGITLGQAMLLTKDQKKRMEIDNIFLLYCDDDLDINSAKRYILDIIGGAENA